MEGLAGYQVIDKTQHPWMAVSGILGSLISMDIGFIFNLKTFQEKNEGCQGVEDKLGTLKRKGTVPTDSKI